LVFEIFLSGHFFPPLPDQRSEDRNVGIIYDDFALRTPEPRSLEASDQKKLAFLKWIPYSLAIMDFAGVLMKRDRNDATGACLMTRAN
jgi:hypothetical protein